MKPFHLILLILAGIGIATVISMYGNTTQYVRFPMHSVFLRKILEKRYMWFVN